VDRRRGRGRGAAALLAAVPLALALLSGCTGGEGADELEPPEPPPVEDTAGPPTGRDVVVVLPAATTLDALVLDGLAGRLAALEDGLPEQVGALRIRRPDTAPFVADLLELAATRDAQLACVLGAGTQELADTVARRHGRTTVCTLPAELPPTPDEGASPPPAVRVDAPVQALGRVVGAAARAAVLARSRPTDDEDVTAPAPLVVGLVLSGDELDTDRFRAGLLEGLGEVEAIEAASADADPADAVAAVIAAGAEVVVLDGGAGASEALAAIPTGLGVLVPTDLAPSPEADPAEGPALVLAYRLRWEDLLAEVVARTVEGTLRSWRAEATAEVLELQPGPGVPGLEAALEAVLASLQPEGEGAPVTAPPGGSTGDVDP
jgi:hypothetical protein